MKRSNPQPQGSSSLAEKITPLVFLKIVLLLVLIAPQASTQDRCEVDQGMRDMIDSTFSKWTSTPGGGNKNVYVSNISFMDGFSKTLLLSEEASLIDEAVQDGMQAAADTNSNIIVNDPQHTTPNTDASVNKLAEISFNPNLSPDEKYSQAVAELLDPYSVDVLITGMIIDTGEIIQVRTMGVSIPDRTIKTKDKTYADRDAMFQDVGGTLKLTQTAHEEIKKAVKDILINL